MPEFDSETEKVKEVLIITYYWPPSGGGGVQRWLKFVKYLPQFGWKPIVYTPENPSFDLKDNSLENDVSQSVEVLKRKIWEPFELYKRLFKKKKKDLKQGVVNDQNSSSLVSRLIIWIRGNLFFPDPRVFWAQPSAKFLKSYIVKNDIKLIITTGPPHSMHKIGLKLKQSLGDQISWIADFRDPWSQWDILTELKTSKYIRRKHAKLERNVLHAADEVITVSQSLAEDLSRRGSRGVNVITNGFDSQDIVVNQEVNTKKFVISHIGLMNELRNPVNLWLALKELCGEIAGFKDDLEICLAGAVSSFIVENLQGDEDLKDSFRYVSYMPHDEVFDQYANSAILLLLVNTSSNAKWILPGKAFEYMAMKRPILCLAKRGIDLEKVLTDAGYDSFFEYSEKDQIKSYIFESYRKFKEGKVISENVEVVQFERKTLTGQLSKLLNENLN